MADLKYTVAIDASQATNAINTLKGAVGGLLTAFSVKELSQFSDSITGLRNKLLQLTPDMSNVNKQFDAIAAIAMSSRAPLGDVADLYFRIARNTQALGISQKDAAQITESLSKALTASGQSTQQAAGALLQFGQGLQSGVFQGDELRSILENLPPVAEAIAKSLNVPIASLKKLGSDGQISADIVVKAMLAAKDSIDAAFGRTIPTISQAFTNLKTAVGVAFNEFEQNTQTGQNFALAIEYMAFQVYKLSKSIDDVIGPLKIVVEVALALAAFTLAGRIFAAFAAAVRTVWVAVTSLGATFWLFVEGLKDFGAYMAMAGSKLQNFGGAVLMLIGPLKTLAEAIISVGAAIYTWSGIEWVVNKIKGLGDKSSDTRKELDDFREELKKNAQQLDETKGKGDNYTEMLKRVAEAAAKARLEMNLATGNLDRNLAQTREKLTLENEILAANKETTQISKDNADIMRLQTEIDINRRNAIQEIKDQIAKLNLEYSQLKVKDSERGLTLKAQIGILQEQIKKTGDIYDQHERGMIKETQRAQTLKLLEEFRQQNLQNMVKAIEDQIKRSEKLGDILRGINDQMRDLDFEKSMIGKGGADKAIAEIKEKARKGALEAGRAYAAAFEDTGDGMTPEKAQEFANGLEQITQGYKKIADAQIANYEAGRTFEAGWKEAFANYVDNATNAANIARDAFGSFTSNMNSALDNFVMTGKFKFGDFARSIIQDILKIQLRASAAKLFAAASEGGGFFSAVGKLFGFAEGGDPPVGVPSIVGERGPELFVPKTAGTIMPTGSFSSATRAPAVTNVYNINAVDAKSVAQLFYENRQTLFGTVEAARKEMPMRR